MMGIKQPRLAFGSAGIGNLFRPVSDAAARAAIDAALAGGIADFDTAPHYGFGLAERRLGEALAASDAGRMARVSTKVGRRLVPCDVAGSRHGFVDADPFEPVFDYSRDGVLRTFEQSLARLRRDRVDTLFVHDLGRRTHGALDPVYRRQFLTEGYGAMMELQASGAVDRIGLGVNEIEVCLELLSHIEFDVILLAGRYTLLEQGGLADLLPLCLKRGVSLYMGGPFNSGILASETDTGPYDYAAPSPDIVARVVQLRRACEAHNTPLRAAALAFAGSHRAAEAVVAGMSSADEVEHALRDWSCAVPPLLWADLAMQGLIDPAAVTALAESAQ